MSIKTTVILKPEVYEKLHALAARRKVMGERSDVSRLAGELLQEKLEGVTVSIRGLGERSTETAA